MAKLYKGSFVGASTHIKFRAFSGLSWLKKEYRVLPPHLAMSDILPNHQVLQFPLVWHARLIVLAEIATTREGIEQTFAAMGLTLTDLTQGSASSGGRYCTWQISANIPSLPHFRAVSKALSELPGVKMLL